MCLEELTEILCLPCGTIIHKECHIKATERFPISPFSDLQCHQCRLIHVPTTYQQQWQQHKETEKLLQQQSETQEGMLHTMETLVDNLDTRVQAMPELVKLRVEMAGNDHKRLMEEQMRKLRLLKEKILHEERSRDHLAGDLAREIPERIRYLQPNSRIPRWIMQEISSTCSGAVRKMYQQDSSSNPPV
jgi:hypothetical protein